MMQLTQEDFNSVGITDTTQEALEKKQEFVGDLIDTVAAVFMDNLSELRKRGDGTKEGKNLAAQHTATCSTLLEFRKMLRLFAYKQSLSNPKGPLPIEYVKNATERSTDMAQVISKLTADSPIVGLLFRMVSPLTDPKEANDGAQKKEETNVPEQTT